MLLWYQYSPLKTIVLNKHSNYIDNPSRGLYVQINSEKRERIASLKDKENVNLVFLEYDIYEYVDTSISQMKLEELDDALQVAKESDLDVIFRAAYGYDSDYKYKDPMDIERIVGHIKQISPILNNYREQILCVQAGMLGPWGEWHSSNLIGDDENQNKVVRNGVLSAWLENLDESIIINVRRPRFLRDAVSAGLEKTRIGLHNDALFSTDSDMGTYDDEEYNRSEELKWAEESLVTGINGGEMPQLSDYTELDNVLEEMRQLKITYLNKKYNTQVLDYWNTQEIEGVNGLDFICNHLGYRYHIENMKASETIKNNNLTIRMEWMNTGFAPIKEGYELYLILKQGQKIYSYPIEDHNLHTLQSGDVRELSKKIKLEDELLTGFEVGVKLCLEVDKMTGDNNLSVELANHESKYMNGVNYLLKYEVIDEKLVLE